MVSVKREWFLVIFSMVILKIGHATICMAYTKADSHNLYRILNLTQSCLLNVRIQLYFHCLVLLCLIWNLYVFRLGYYHILRQRRNLVVIWVIIYRYYSMPLSKKESCT